MDVGHWRSHRLSSPFKFLLHPSLHCSLLFSVHCSLLSSSSPTPLQCVYKSMCVCFCVVDSFEAQGQSISIWARTQRNYRGILRILLAGQCVWIAAYLPMVTFAAATKLLCFFRLTAVWVHNE